MARICLHCFVSGQVQGVCYRQYAYKQAVARRITGWARNLDDGRVEVICCGERVIVEEFRDLLWKGSPQSRVTDVQSEEIRFQVLDDFSIR